MNKICFYLNFFLYITLNSFSVAHFECVSLGPHCTTATVLKIFKLRMFSYPFDWLVSSYDSLYSTLKDDFKDFLNPDFLHARSDNCAVINKYGLVFYHDFPIVDAEGKPLVHGVAPPISLLSSSWLDGLPEIQEKFERRISRFRRLCQGTKKVYFFRQADDTSLEQACTLRNLLQNQYPHLDFTLVILQQNSPEQWHESNIKNYYLDPAEPNHLVLWKTFLADLGIISSRNVQISDEQRNEFHIH